ncbi:NnrS family protein [Devosia submarina]|uniref:NnrS family protein n=1 Tax=Devosia submarina TaxID=1173082 RepID=UPI000D3597A2|nr:NnrS family protein [Devosia submarina]
MTNAVGRSRTPVPRGLTRTGPVILSYGFRPFFLAAAIWGFGAMGLWVLALSGSFTLSVAYGPTSWHAHEMLFGYSSAALAGFVLTTIPNWTGRLPVSGLPLLGLFLLWCAGRVALLCADIVGSVPAAAVDSIFLPVLFAVCAREIVGGKKWKDIKIVSGILALSIANILFHYSVIGGYWTATSSRLAISAYVMLIMIIGGRILPSFTRNWLSKRGEIRFPVPYNTFDTLSLVIALAALFAWVIKPEGPVTGVLCLAASAVQAFRLSRWRGWTTGAEGLVVILHAAYGFVVLGFAAVAASAVGVFDPLSALHVMTVGCIGTMTLAVMTRATRGHTGLELHASPITVASYGAMVFAALLRPIAGVLPDAYMALVSLSGAAWIAAFLLYLIEYARPLASKRKYADVRQRGKDSA